MAKRIKRNYDRGYVDACDKIRVFIGRQSIGSVVGQWFA